MLRWAIGLWVLGLITIVPYGTYYLLFHAVKEQYPILITLVLFWVLGYWSIVGPIMGIIKVRRVYRAIERAKSKREIEDTLRNDQAREVFIDVIARDNHIPRFLAAKVYRLLAHALSNARRKDAG